MLTEERYQYILEYLQAHGSVTVAELTGQLGASESTIRRDLNALGNLGKLSKVHGGATALHLDFSYVEHPIETKPAARAARTARVISRTSRGRTARMGSKAKAARASPGASTSATKH